MIFLGTGAADTIPNTFCSCPICEEARTAPHLYTRKRACFMLDKHNVIDFGPDYSCATQMYGIVSTKLRNVFITHTHEDHFCESNLGLITMSRTKLDNPLKLFISEKGVKRVRGLIEALDNDLGRHMDFVNAIQENYATLESVKPFEEFDVDGMSVFSIETRHKVQAQESGERALNYRFTCKDGTKLLYACDTGRYTKESLLALKDSDLDILILEATFGNTKIDQIGHHDCYSFVEEIDAMKEYGIVTKKTRIFATHINHKHDMNHERYQLYLDEHCSHPVTIAYDGMVIGEKY